MVFAKLFVRVSKEAKYANVSGWPGHSFNRAFRAKRPRAGVARAFFDPRIIRVSRAGRYANDFCPIFRSCIGGSAIRERLVDPGSWPGGGRGPRRRPSSVELQLPFVRETGVLYDSRPQGGKRGLSGHETGEKTALGKPRARSLQKRAWTKGRGEPRARNSTQAKRRGGTKGRREPTRPSFLETPLFFRPATFRPGP